MSTCRTSIVSILNNDDNPSFAVRSAPRLSRTHISSSQYPHSERPPSPISDPQYTRPAASSQSPATSPRGSRHHSDAVTEVAQPASPGSSDGSAYDYLTSQPSSYHPYARQDPRREPYRFPARGPAAPRTSPETRSTTSETASQTGATRGTGRKNKYPCPYAASHGCSSTFTTSGHAARHGKKHTGEKSVHCPICNKAFTRKDNMKQHIRTHRSHSDEMRSISEPEPDARWAMARPDAVYASVSHQRNVSQPIEAGVRPVPGSVPVPGPQAP
ncbi:transcriptional regulator family: C2H2 zinc finger [Penicillium psychrosexuale]|uniref:transcriptional regulator family: C2H2 zinc finger n=1 Tax=Penicillium psychrosexuale TaxID=1002107 RepID=UPI0025454579|nr:transcriptional regulator family: C2H2 zinc finger [Penicillium psychrosexuale]KAJ5799403.1 transcriptional regulator family: C2H2 zinc finger [Penicillium psychrosexuale]